MNGRVSVVIPCFNAETTVGEAIESVLAQSWRDLEVIAIDDGSNDDSASILRSFGQRIKAEFGPNRGVSAARNSGTAIATGGFIQYLDADDLLGPEAIEQRFNALQETEADVAYSDWQRFDTDLNGSRRLGEVVAQQIDDIDSDPELACATGFWAPPAAILYTRHIVDAIGGWSSSLPVIQDARFLFDAARRQARFVHVTGVSAFYRDAGTSLSRGNSGQFMLDIYRNGIEIQSLWEADGPLTEKRKTALAGMFDMTARTFFQLGMPEFDDAVARLRSITKRRFGYPEVAHHVSQIAGRDVAVAAVGLGARVMYGLRVILESRREPPTAKN